MPIANSNSASLLCTMRSTRSTKRAQGTPSWTLARTTGQCRSLWSRTTDAGPSTPRRVRRRSSTAASAATNSLRSVRCSPASMRNTIISSVPGRQAAAANMPCAWSARPAITMGCIGLRPRARTKARWGRWSMRRRMRATLANWSPASQFPTKATISASLRRKVPTGMAAPRATSSRVG